MQCPKCSERLKVLRSIPVEGGDTPYIIRKRQCASCGRRVTTEERIVGSTEIKKGEK